MKTQLHNWFTGTLKTVAAFALIATASSTYAQCPTSISITDTPTCFGDTLGALTLASNSYTPIIITEVDRNSPDLIEIQNVTGLTFDVTGYYVACSDSYTDINLANTLTWQLSGVVPIDWVDYRDDAGAGNYWGNNLFFNSPSAGWVAICDASHNVIDILFWEWSAADIANFAPVVAGNQLIFDPAQWIGGGLVSCGGGSMVRSTNLENNDAADWACGATPSAGVSNITVTPVTPDPITSILWSTTETTMSISGLSAGSYSIEVNYQSGCIGTDTVTLVEPAQVTGTATTTDILCFGDSNGTASIATSGGTGTITVDWGANDPNGLALGYSAYTMTDSVGCTGMDSVLITQPTAIDLSLTGQSIACFADSSGGSVLAIGTGGTPGYSYVWSTGDTTSSVSGLSTGWYNVTVADTNGCMIQDSVEITSPSSSIALNGTTVDEISGNDGSIDLTVTGGTPPYSFAWTNGAASVEDPTGLAGGLYDVTVTDSNGCIMTGTYIVNSQVGIDELSTLLFSVSPNPNNGHFTLSIDPSVGAANVEIVNSLGQLIYSDELSSTEKSISLHTVEVGVYFVRVSNATTNSVMRIVIK